MKEKCKKQNKKNNQTQKGARGTEAIELNDFVVHLSYVFCS